MTFKKINENTIRCVLTEEDMEENDIGLEDFFTNNREKIHGFLDTIMEEAKKEVGYENDGTVLSMQLMPLPSNGLAITITGSKENDFNDVLGNVKNMIESIHDSSQCYSGFGFESQDKEDIVDDVKPEKVCEIPAPTCMIVKFETMRLVEEYCEAVFKLKNIKSILYKDADGTFYMEICKGRASKETFYRACMVAREYGSPMFDNPFEKQRIMEHCECLMEKKVIEYLGQ